MDTKNSPYRALSSRGGYRIAKSDCGHCPVRNSAACRGMHEPGLADANAVSYRKTVTQGQTILREGDPVAWCGLIVAGVVKLVKTSPDGRQQIVGLQFGSEYLGQPFQETWRLSAEAATDVELCCFSQTAFDQLRAKNPGLESSLLQDAMVSLDGARDWMFVLGRKTAEEKLASFLVFMAERMPVRGADTGVVFEGDLPLSRTEISQFLGLRIETVSRNFRKLKAAGVIDTTGNRGLTIKDLARLRAMADSDEG